MIYKTIHCILLKDISRGNPPLSINKKNLSDSILKVDVHLFCRHWLLSISLNKMYVVVPFSSFA